MASGRSSSSSSSWLFPFTSTSGQGNQVEHLLVDRFYRKVPRAVADRGADPVPGVTRVTSGASQDEEWFWEQILVNGRIVVPPDKVFPEWSATLTMDGE